MAGRREQYKNSVEDYSDESEGSNEDDRDTNEKGKRSKDVNTTKLPNIRVNAERGKDKSSRNPAMEKNRFSKRNDRDDLNTPVRDRLRERSNIEEKKEARKEKNRSDTDVRNGVNGYHKENSQKANLSTNNSSRKVTFYKNGSKNFSVTLLINKRNYRNFDVLLEDLTKAITLPYGCRIIFNKFGDVVKDLHELQSGEYYICSSDKKFIKHIDYGGNKAPSGHTDLHRDSLKVASSSDFSQHAGRSRHSSSSSGSGPKLAPATAESLKPRVVTVIHNVDRNQKCTILLNRRTTQNFEEVLRDVTETLLESRSDVIRSLYTVDGRKVGGLSELFRGPDTFIAVGSEGFKKDSSQSSRSGGSNDSNNSQKRRKKRKPTTPENKDLSQVKIHIPSTGHTHIFNPPSKYDDYEVDVTPHAPPEAHLQLDWVYGFRGKDTRCNLYILPSGEVVYFVAAVVVIYNRTTETQRHYTGHGDEIKCLAVHPNQWYIATGQASGKSQDHNDLSHIRVWDAETLITLTVLCLEQLDLNITCLTFSQRDGGKHLVSVDAAGSDYRVCYWEWENSNIIAKSKGYPNTVVCIATDPDDDNLLVSCGKQHVFFWKLKENKLERKSGFFEKHEIPQFFTCLTFAPSGDIITGDSNGTITVWGKVSKKIKFAVRNAHEKSVLSLCLLDNGLLISGGGVDRRIEVWDANKYFNTPMKEIELVSDVGGINAIVPLPDTTEDDLPDFLLATTSNSILEGSFNSQFSEIVIGHQENVQALAVHPQDQSFVTVGHDKIAMLWSAESHVEMWKVSVEFSALCADFHPAGGVLVIGTSVGRWIVLNAESGFHISSFQDGREPITEIKYSPGGDFIAVGSVDGNIYIHSVMDDGTTYRRTGKCMGNSTAVKCLDWSSDGCHIQCCLKDYSLSVWDIHTMETETSVYVIKDMELFTRNVMLGYDVAGVWPDDKECHVTCLSQSHLSDLVASGDTDGVVKLFKYPCSQHGSEFHQYKTHGSAISRVDFLTSFTFLVTCGGKDTAVMQWRIVGKINPIVEKSVGKQKDELPQIHTSKQEPQTPIIRRETPSDDSEPESDRNELDRRNHREDKLGMMDDEEPTRPAPRRMYSDDEDDVDHRKQNKARRRQYYSDESSEEDRKRRDDRGRGRRQRRGRDSSPDEEYTPRKGNRRGVHDEDSDETPSRKRSPLRRSRRNSDEDSPDEGKRSHQKSTERQRRRGSVEERRSSDETPRNRSDHPKARNTSDDETPRKHRDHRNDERKRNKPRSRPKDERDRSRDYR